jgi:hypothetical protein|tara:strand:- start:419 stop:1591 length:1173 start_codon:yes stop_codon:yes gene_type:complete
MADVVIPEFQGIRSVVPGTYDPKRRPGSGAQRYFTDMKYVPGPSFRGDRGMYDVKNYLLANPDVVTQYNEDKDALIAGGDERFETVEGYGKYHYDTFGKWENRKLTPDSLPSPATLAQAASDAAALEYQTLNANNPARQGLASLQRVTDAIIKKDIGDIEASDANDRQKIDQTMAYMNKNAVSPYRLSEVTGTPFSNIQNTMHPFYQTQKEQAAQSSPNEGIQAALNNAVTETQTRPYQNFLRNIPVDGVYSTEEMSSVTDLLNSGNITIEQIATYFGKPVEEVRQFYRQQGNRQGFNSGGLTSLGGQGMYLGGPTDGMADNVPASINNNEPARLSDGEFVVPADVVSHLGNGNSDAGAKQLYSMMDRVREARTGRAEQGREINPNKFLA